MIMAAIRHMLYWWERGDAARVIAHLEALPGGDQGDGDERDLERYQTLLDRRVDQLTKELATQRRVAGDTNEKHS